MRAQQDPYAQAELLSLAYVCAYTFCVRDGFFASVRNASTHVYCLARLVGQLVRVLGVVLFSHSKCFLPVPLRQCHHTLRFSQPGLGGNSMNQPCMVAMRTALMADSCFTLAHLVSMSRGGL
jgi:hypothetical protein